MIGVTKTAPFERSKEPDLDGIQRDLLAYRLCAQGNEHIERLIRRSVLFHQDLLRLWRDRPHDRSAIG